MTLKRTIDSLFTGDGKATINSVHQRPAKRQMTDSPVTPLFAARRSSLPKTPRTRTPYPSRPIDSPSNPVGRKRPQIMAYSLPPPTSFSKHLPLRFQLVRPNSSPRMGGVYRIVQVPLSYTFVHLRCLIAFLFGGGHGDPYKDRHLFELKKKVAMYALTYRPGQIRTGYTAKKLSTARDPCRYQPTFDDDILQAGVEIEERKSDVDDSIDDGESEDQGWFWELEEEFTLGHVWPNGGDLTRGIVYHHDETTAVHITINTTPLPRRSGISNVPYVFSARGQVRLFPHFLSRLPKPVFSVPISKLTLPSRDLSCPVSPTNTSSSPESGGSPSSLFDGDDDSVSGEDIDSDEFQEDLNAMLNPEKFNASDAFITYLRYVYQHGTLYQHRPGGDSETDDDDDIPCSTPGLTYTSSSPASSPLPSSSDTFSGSPLTSSRNRATLMFDDAYTTSSSPLISALFVNQNTPAPQHAIWQRRRLDRVQKRMDKDKRRAWLCLRDEEDEKEEVDELFEDNSSFKPSTKPKSSWRKNHYQKKRCTGKRPSKPPPLWVKPQLKPGEIWDPFGDEIEV